MVTWPQDRNTPWLATSKVNDMSADMDPKAGAYPPEVGQLGVLGPVLLSGAAHQGEDLVDLLDVALALKQGGIQDELPHDAAQAPHVYGCRVLLHACKHVRSACCASVEGLYRYAKHGLAGTAQKASSKLLTWLCSWLTRFDAIFV